MKKTLRKDVLILVLVVIVSWGTWNILHLFGNYQVRAEKNQSKKVYQENIKNTYLDYLSQLANTKDNVKIAVIGSSVTKGTGASSIEKSWPSQFYYALKGSGLYNVELVNLGFSGYKAHDLLSKRKVSELFREQPDLIIFETSVINNFRQSSTMDQTFKYIDILLQKFKKELSAASVLVVSPNPILTTEKNHAGLYFKDYMEQTEKHIKENGYHYVNIYKRINDYVSKENDNLADYLSDDIHPNDRGYKLWSEILMAYLKNEKCL